MNEERLLLDLNTAEVDELRQLPGVGPAMAERIVAARPFESVDDLRRVAGVGPAFLDRLRSLAVTEFPAAEGGEPTLPEAEPIMVDEPALPGAEISAEVELAAVEPVHLDESEEPLPAEPVIPEPTPPVPPAKLTPQPKIATKEPALVTRGQALWLVFGSSLVVLVFAVAITLGILSSVNDGRLEYANPAQLNALDRELDGLAAELDAVGKDVQGLQTRLDNLEGLSGRMRDVEAAVDALQSDVEAAAEQVDSLAEQLDGVDEQIQELHAQSNQFQGFLDGLRDLLTPKEESK